MLKLGEKGAIPQRDTETYAIAPHIPCGMVTPELQISTESSVISHINRHWTLTANTNGESGIYVAFYSTQGYGPYADHLIPDLTQGPTTTPEASGARETVASTEFLRLLLPRHKNKVPFHFRFGDSTGLFSGYDFGRGAHLTRMEWNGRFQGLMRYPCT